MKALKGIFAIAFGVSAFLSLESSAATQSNCTWYNQSISSMGATNVCVEIDMAAGTGKIVATQVFRNSMPLGGVTTCTITTISGYFYTGTCGSPVIWKY